MAEILRQRKAEVPNVTMKVSHELGDSALRMAGRLTLEVPETIRMDLLKKKILLAAREDVLGVEEVEITVTDNIRQRKYVRHQLPLVLARACTIHKAQGRTVETLVYVPGKSFASGQAYVALSRVKVLRGLYIIRNSPGYDMDLVNTLQDSKVRVSTLAPNYT